MIASVARGFNQLSRIPYEYRNANVPTGDSAMTNGRLSAPYLPIKREDDAERANSYPASRKNAAPPIHKEAAMGRM